MNWSILVIFSALIAICFWVWYSIKRVANSEQVEQDAKEAQDRVDELERAALEAEDAIRAKEKETADEIVKANDGSRAAELLRDAFKSRNK